MSIFCKRESLKSYCDIIEDNLSVYSAAERKVVDMQLAPAQKQIINGILNENKLLIAKPRQVGASSALAAFCGAYACKNQSKEILLIGPTRLHTF